MTDKEYEQKKRECWKNFKFARRPLNTDKKVFDYIFDRAYALGKQTETITQEDIEKAAEDSADNFRNGYQIENTLKSNLRVDMVNLFKDAVDFALGKQEKPTATSKDIGQAAEKHADELTVPPSLVGALVPLLHDVAKSSYMYGAQDFIGKQEKDADTVIHGWVARERDNDLLFYYGDSNPIKNENGYWNIKFGSSIMLENNNLFPDLTWDDDPQEVELVIKRKKK